MPITQRISVNDPRSLTPQKITFAEMRDMGVRGLLVYCAGLSADNGSGQAASWQSRTSITRTLDR
jgi:hypothetical protein